MTLPLAVATSNPAPGFYLTVDLLRGSTSPGSTGLRALIVSPQAESGGDLGADTEIRAVYSAEEVETAQGKSLGYFAFKALLSADPEAQVDIVGPAKLSGAAATGTFTFTGAPTANETYEVKISGIEIETTWLVGESVHDAATRLAAAINQAGDSLWVTAAVGAGPGYVVTITARGHGTSGNDITMTAKRTAGTGGTLTLGAATCSGGTGDSDFTNALALVAGREYDYILVCCSNTDANGAGTTNVARLGTHIDAYKTGANARLQQGVVGVTGTIAQAKTATAARNDEDIELICDVNGQELPVELAGWELGNRMKRRRLESNANRCLEVCGSIVRGSNDVVADQPTAAERTDAINYGVTLIAYTDSGAPMLLRPISTRHKDSSGNPDYRARDLNEIDALYDYAKDLRMGLPQEFQSSGSQVKVARDRETGDDELPQGVVEERDIRAWIINRTKSYWVPKGVIDGTHFQTIIDSGELAVEVNDGDETQVDIFIPARAFKILAKMGLYLAKVG
jgi:phage tail sheath gpL-like